MLDVLWHLLNAAHLNTFLAARARAEGAVSSDYPQEAEIAGVRDEGVRRSKTERVSETALQPLKRWGGFKWW